MTTLELPRPLITRRRPLHRDELLGVVTTTAADRDRWAPLVQRPATDRWWIRLAEEPDLDLWLLTWLPGQGTELHDHGRSGAAFTVVTGELEELRPTSARTYRATGAGPSEPAWVAPGDLHDVRGAGQDLAVSIHAYSPPLTQMTYYRRSPSGSLLVDRRIDSREPERDDQADQGHIGAGDRP